MATGGINLSKEFFELLKAIGESKSKQEEDRIIAREVACLKRQMESPPAGASSGANSSAAAAMTGVLASAASGGGVQSVLLSSKKRAKEFLVRLLYVEMLGHDASFGYIKAVEMAASASLYHKRTGYLVCGACLPPTHEFRFMLVNQMQRDLQSTNVLECCGGILACTNLITSDMVPAVATEVAKLLHHDSATIRKKTIICLHRLYQLADDVVTAEQLQEYLRKVLCDKDPAVMGSSLNVIQSLAAKNPLPFKDLVPSLVSILKQIGDHRLPAEFDYHRLPAPWMQCLLVRILGMVGRADAAASAGMYEILADTLKKADIGINAGYAVVYECIKTIVSIYPNPALLDAAADAISRFIQSRSHNLKYLGVTGLALIVEQHPQYAAQHQLAVMDCLEDPDETLQRKTLDLLYRMTNPVNVEFIAEKLLAFLNGPTASTDLFLKRQLTVRVCSIAERYAPNNAWYIRTVTQLMEVSGDLVASDVAQNLMSLIAEGVGDDEEADMLLRQNAVEIYVNILTEKNLGTLPRILLETMAWCLGEYAYLSVAANLEQVCQLLCQLAQKHKAKLAPSTRKFIVTAVMKLTAQLGRCPDSAAALIQDYTRSKDADLQQRCLEFQNVLTHAPALLPELLPVDSSAEDIHVDENLSFLDGFVRQALANGARPYQKPEDDDDDDDENNGGRFANGYHSGGGGGGSGKTDSGFKMTPYEKPLPPSQVMLAMSGIGSAGRTSTLQAPSLPPGAAAVGGGSVLASPAAAPPPQLALNTRNVANVWGKGGLKPGGAPEPVAAAPAVAPPVSAPAPAAVWDHHPSTSSSAYGGGHSVGGGYGARPAAAAEQPIVKTAAQLEKERQAAALFGGIVPGMPPPPPTQASAPAAAPPPPPRPVVPVAAAAPAPAPAAEIDLLDMSAWDAPTPAAAAPAAVPDFDILSPMPMGTAAAAAPTVAAARAAPGTLVETVLEDENEVGIRASAGAAAAAPSKPSPLDEDPFASAGLLGDFQQQPLHSLERSLKFEFNGNELAPMKITTAQFGQKWGSCPATTPASVSSSGKIRTLNQFMEVMEKVGAHPIEAIAATNEGICAGMIAGGTQYCLVHGKVTRTTTTGGSNIAMTIKSTDVTLGGTLAMYLQTMLR